MKFRFRIFDQIIGKEIKATDKQYEKRKNG